MLDCPREQLALQVYFKQLNHPQVSFSVKQKQPATLDKAVAATVEMETYLPPKTAASVTELEHSSEADLDVITPMTLPSLKQGEDKFRQILVKIIQRLEALETARKPAMSSLAEATCYRCGRKGHIGQNCHQDRREDIQHKANPNRQRTPKWQLQHHADEQNRFTIATFHKQVEKGCDELATEKTDNERLKKMLVRLQSSQSDQMSKVVSEVEVEELRMKLKLLSLKSRNCWQHWKVVNAIIQRS